MQSGHWFNECRLCFRQRALGNKFQAIWPFSHGGAKELPNDIRYRRLLHNQCTYPPPRRSNHQDYSTTISSGKRPGALTRNSCESTESHSTEICLARSPFSQRKGFLPNPDFKSGRVVTVLRTPSLNSFPTPSKSTPIHPSTLTRWKLLRGQSLKVIIF